MRGHSSILIIYFCFFRMADHEVISYWKLGHTINVINGLSETADGGEKKKKKSIKSRAQFMSNKTRQQASHGHYWIAFF